MSAPLVPQRIVEAVGGRDAVIAALTAGNPVEALEVAGVDEAEARRLGEGYLLASAVRFADGTTFGRLIDGHGGNAIEERR